MGLFDKFRKTQDQQQPNAEEVKSAIQTTCANMALFFRDANLPVDFINKYQKGMIIREYGFVDVTGLGGGMVTNHRYLILSNHMFPMFQLQENKQWGNCLANRDSRFLVLGTGAEKGKYATVLLHLNNDTWHLFKSIDMRFSERLLDSCLEQFSKRLDVKPFTSVTTSEWLKRCQFPVGMSDDGQLYPIDD